MKVILGEQTKVNGYTTIDFCGEPDILFDLNNGIPLPSDSVDSLTAYHVIEHLDSLVDIMKEIHRVCRLGAEVEIKVPYQVDGFNDPTHKIFFSDGTFYRFTKEFWDNYGVKCWFLDNQWFQILSQYVIEQSYGRELMLTLKVVKE